MSEEKLRALLAEAREFVALFHEAGCPADQCEGCAAANDMTSRIDAALAEPVAEYAPNYASEARSLRARLNDAERERDEARAEVERLKADLDVVDSDLQLAVKRLTAEVERLRGLTPELPPRPTDGKGLPRYGLRWNGPTKPIAVPMDDGYWTPWHLADAAYQRGAEAMREAAMGAAWHSCAMALHAKIRALPVPEDKP